MSAELRKQYTERNRMCAGAFSSYEKMKTMKMADFVVCFSRILNDARPRLKEYLEEHPDCDQVFKDLKNENYEHHFDELATVLSSKKYVGVQLADAFKRAMGNIKTPWEILITYFGTEEIYELTKSGVISPSEAAIPRCAGSVYPLVPVTDPKEDALCSKVFDPVASVDSFMFGKEGEPTSWESKGLNWTDKDIPMFCPECLVKSYRYKLQVSQNTLTKFKKQDGSWIKEPVPGDTLSNTIASIKALNDNIDLIKTKFLPLLDSIIYKGSSTIKTDLPLHEMVFNDDEDRPEEDDQSEEKEKEELLDHSNGKDHEGEREEENSAPVSKSKKSVVEREDEDDSNSNDEDDVPKTPAVVEERAEEMQDEKESEEAKESDSNEVQQPVQVVEDAMEIEHSVPPPPPSPVKTPQKKEKKEPKKSKPAEIEEKPLKKPNKKILFDAEAENDEDDDFQTPPPKASKTGTKELKKIESQDTNGHEKMNSPLKSSTDTPVSPVKKVSKTKHTEDLPHEKDTEQETKTKAKPKAQKAAKVGKAQSHSDGVQTEEKVKGKAKAKKSIEEEVEEALHKPKAKKGKKAVEEIAEQKEASPKATAGTPTAASKKRKREDENGEQTEETPKKKAKTTAAAKKGKKTELLEEVESQMEVENGETHKKNAPTLTLASAISKIPYVDDVYAAFSNLEEIMRKNFTDPNFFQTLHNGFARMSESSRIIVKAAVDMEVKKNTPFSL